MAGSSKGQAAALAAEHFMLHEHANDAGMAKCSTVGGEQSAQGQELAVPAPRFEGLDFLFSF